MSEVLTALSVIFIIAGGLLLVANHYRLSTVPFLTFAGILAGQFIQEGLLLEFARWGIAFLVFVFGVNLDLQRIYVVVRDSQITAVALFAVMGGLGFGIGFLLIGFDRFNALYFAIAAALSSTIVGTGLLQVEIRGNLVYGRLAHSIHFVQDLIAILFVLILSIESITGEAVATNLALGIGLLLGALLINQVFFEQLLKLAAGSQELLMISSISILIGFLAVAEFFGVSIVVGAFAAGLAIKRDFTRNLGMLNGIESIKDFFVAIFFVTLGALVAVPTLDVLLGAFLLFVLTAIIKPLMTIFMLIREGYDARAAAFTSFSLDQVSEFTLIIAIEAFILGVLLPELFDAIVLAAAATMITSGYTRRYDERLYASLQTLGLIPGTHEKIDTQSQIRDDLSGHVIIVGFGRQGRRLVDRCESLDRPYVVIENDPAMLASMHESCRNFVFGDALDGYTWQKATLASATLIVSSVDQRRVSKWVLSLDTPADIILRTRTPTVAEEFLADGAYYVVVPDLLASESLIGVVEAILADKQNRERFRAAHLEEFEAFDQAGFKSLGDARSVPK